MGSRLSKQTHDSDAFVYFRLWTPVQNQKRRYQPMSKQAIMKVPYSNRCTACLSRREGANENKHLRCTCSNSLRLEQTCILWEADADYYILHKQINIHLCVYRTFFLVLLGKLHDVIKDLCCFFLSTFRKYS